MSSTEWQGGDDAERVNPEELDDVPAGSSDEEGGAGDLGSEIGEGESVGTGWTEGGGMPAEGSSEREEHQGLT